MASRIVWPAAEGRDGTFAALMHAATPGVRVRVLAERWGKVCELCGDDIDLNLAKPHPGAPEADHVVPLGAPTFGSANWGNLRLTHAYCNNARRGGEVDRLTRRAAFRQTCIDFADRPFWFGRRALHAESNVRGGVEAASRSNDPEHFESEIAAALRVVYGNLKQLGGAASNTAFDINHPERYDERLEGLRPWAAFVAEMAEAAGSAGSLVDDAADQLESGRMLSGHVVREMRQMYGPRWEDVLADDDELIGYDEEDADGLPVPRSTGDQYDGGFGPDSYFVHAMQKNA